MTLRDALIAARRLSILRLVAECGGALNEAVIRSAIRRQGYALAGADSIRADLDHLVEYGCLTARWEARLRIVELTERGEDAAHGRIAVEGVEQAIWRQG
jgi:repressor of nif and glnA expression